MDEAEYDRFVRANLRRNYAAHYLHGMLGMTGFRILNAPTFVPVYLFSLSGSNFIVGLGLFLQQVGAVLLPVFGAAHLEHRKRVLPAAMWLGTGMRLPILLMAIAGWTLEGQALLVTLLVLLLLLGLSGGAQRVVFQLLLAKVIPIEQRGRLQAFRNVTGGLIAAGLSYWAGHYLIERNVLGNGYATTFLIAFVLTSLGLTILRILMVEPDALGLRPKSRARDRLKDLPALLASDVDYRNFLIAQMFAMGARVAAPFYILHAGATGQLSGLAIGIYSLAYLGADTLSNLAWGYLGDRSGFRTGFVASLAIGIAATALLLVAHSMPWFIVAFIGLGAAQSGYLMSATTMVLEFGAREDVAMRLGVSSTVEGLMAAVGPLIGGLIALGFGYPPVFVVAMILQGIALLALIFGVREPRLRKASKEQALEREELGG